MCYKFYFILFLSSCFLFSEEGWLFKIKDSYYKESDMYSFYGMGEWVRSSKEKKQKMVEDFIVRESAYFGALDKGLNFSPSFYEKLVEGGWGSSVCRERLRLFPFYEQLINKLPNQPGFESLKPKTNAYTAFFLNCS